MDRSARFADQEPKTKSARKSVSAPDVSTESSPTAPSSDWSHSHGNQVYDCIRLVVGVGQIDALAKVHFGASYNPAANYACHIWDGQGKFGLFFTRDSLRHSVIAHEISHCVLRVAEYTGWSLSPATTEPASFLTGWIARTVHNDLARHNEKIKNS